MHFQIIVIDNKYYFQLYQGNEKIILISIAFNSKQECINALLLVKKCGRYEENYLRMISSNEQYYFMMRDDNRMELGSSVKTKSMAERNKMLYECIRFIKSSHFNPSSVAG